ncbi:unnamed protein product [Heterobilharzia americana]|nr:unnamed protein product [Heterobilharzia americana]
MDPHNFAYWGRQMIDFITCYLKNIRKYPVIPDVEPGYLRQLLPEEPPEEPEPWSNIFDDVEKYILPGSSASDCIFISMLAARHQAVERYKHHFEEVGDSNPEIAVLSRLVAYASELAHSAVEKASMLGFVKLHQLNVDENLSTQGIALQNAIKVR